jgi:hypothetical protein
LTIRINKQDLLLQIRANPADPQLFELYYCPVCRDFVAVGGLFPALSGLTRHRDCPLAVLPGQDSPLTKEARTGLIQSWLESYRLKLSVTRYQELICHGSHTNSGNWVWLLRGDELADWLAYLTLYLDQLAESWLAALNGQASALFPKPGAIWHNRPFDTGEPFNWDDATLPLAEGNYNRINPLSV